MLYTGKGDDGTTSLWGTRKRYPKNHPIIEALGALDELNSFLGICKIKAKNFDYQPTKRQSLFQILEEVQQHLFTIQAELAGADKTITKKITEDAEATINALEKRLPPIKTFFLPGGSELATHIDFTRTLSRRVERSVIASRDYIKLSEHTLSYLNRLSSLLYALTRFVNFSEHRKETPPTYT